ncbi:MAG: universal stress protein [Gammaproteobacteria bacterium]|nr:universal stress protein [Gammaproteobacteria bacterium]
MKILIPIDGSPHSKKALEFAADLALRYPAKLCILHVLHDSPGSDTISLGAASVTIEASQENLDKAARGLMESAKKVVTDMGCSDVETITRGGHPTQQIIRCARKKGIDVIVLGSRGLSDIKGLLLGSVSHQVNNLAGCTVITVR